jgi:hypothetical protein
MPSFTHISSADTFTTWRIRTNELVDWLNNETKDNNFAGGRAPNATDDASAGYGAGSLWIDESVTPTEAYRCTVSTTGAAIWLNTTLEIGDLGTIVTQDSDDISISGGTLTGVTLTAITDIAVDDGGTGASTASGARTNLGISATNTPATVIGSGTGTSVQAILAELDAASTGLTAHIDDTTDVHDSASIEFDDPTPLSGFAATNVQAAIIETAADLTTHIDDTTDVHDSASIKFFDSVTNANHVGFAATDVQAAILELEVNANAIAADAVLEANVSTGAMAFVLDEDDMTSDSATKLATQQSIKAYVDAVAASELSYRGGYDANANSPDLDTSPSGIKVGDVYIITADGSLFTVAVKVGDMIIAEKDDPTLVGDWTVLSGGTSYVHPNHSGEVTSTGDGATEIANNIVDEANLKIDNTPTDNYVLTAKSSAAGGLTWATTADQTDAEIKTAYEANDDTNEFSDAEKTKLGAATYINTASKIVQRSSTGLINVDRITCPGANGVPITVGANGEGHSEIQFFDDASDAYRSLKWVSTAFQIEDNDGAFAAISTSDTTYTGGTNVAISGTNVISSTDTDTTYTAGDGITLTGTVFSNNLEVNQPAVGNLGLGTNTVNSITTGDYNVALGDAALYNTDTGDGNTAVGYNSLLRHTTGDWNTSLGVAALGFNVSGNNNVAVGAYAIQGSNLSGSGGSDNVGIGLATLGHALFSGSQNIAIGSYTGNDITSGDNNIVIGHNLDAQVATTDNQINIGNVWKYDGTDTTTMAGDLSVTGDYKWTNGSTVESLDTKYAASSHTHVAFSGTTAGLVPTSTATDDTKFLRADGNWVVPTDTTVADTQDLSISGHTISLTNGGSVIVPDNNTTYSNFSGTTAGLVPTSTTTDDTKFLRADGNWVVPTDTTNPYTAQSKASNGYIKLIGGVIIQWGTYTTAGTGVVTFPVAFPTACRSVTTARNHGIVWNYGNEVYAYNKTTSSCTIKISGNSGSNQLGYPVNWMAIGY